LLYHQGGRSIKIKERTNTPILFILGKNALIFLIIINCKFHQKFKNDQNDVIFLYKLLIFPSLNKHKKSPFPKYVAKFPIDPNNILRQKMFIKDSDFIDSVCRTKTIHRFLYSYFFKFRNYFAFTLGCYLFLLFLVHLKNEHSVQLQLYFFIRKDKASHFIVFLFYIYTILTHFEYLPP